ncbi:MAG: dioxygenase [Kofleriaceae bacterium]
MKDFTETSITEAVLDRIKDTPNPRTLEIMRSLVTHLHAFVRETRPSIDEWVYAIEFLTRTGKLCTDVRQEFILLSDALGVSMLVDAINHTDGGTESTVLGPFYVPNIPESPNGADISAGLPGQPLLVEGRVNVPNALVEVWQSDRDGFYDVQRDDVPHPALRGTFRANSEGKFWFWTIQPHFYPIPDDGTVGDMLKATKRHPFRPAHVHFMISAPGYQRLVTHVFSDPDPYLETDAVFAVKQSLIRKFPERTDPPPDGRVISGSWRHLSYDFALVPE